MQASRQYQRRVAAVVSADVVEYTRLIAQNDERTVTTLRACHEVFSKFVATHRGRMFGAAGDSFMLEFADPADAVSCVVAVQAALRRRNKDLPEDERMWFRTGANVGEVLEDNGVLYGETINIAARLQEACPTGGVVVSDLVHTQVSGKANLSFRPLGELWFKNVRHPVRVLEVVNPHDQAPENAPALSVIDVRQAIPGFGSRPALAVLPFENDSRNFDHAYISDGFSEDLAVRLSHLRWLPIIDRNSSFAFRGALTDYRRIGRLLGARYLLDGSVRDADDRLQIAARLVSSESEDVLWSGDYDVRLPDLLVTVDDVAKRIVAALEGRIESAEQGRARGRRRSRLNTWELIWRGRWHLQRLTSADAEEARRLFEEAVATEPDSAEALIHLAWWTWYDAWTQRRPRERLLALRDLSLRALNADELDSRGHLMVASAEILLRNPEAALAHLSEATRLNPSSAYAHAQTGSSHMLLGNCREAIVPLKTCLRLNPHDHYAFYVLGELAAVHHMLGDFKAAIAFADKSLSLRPGYWHARMTKIGALARQGEQSRAAAELAILHGRHPNFSRKYIEWLPFKDRTWIDYFASGVVSTSSERIRTHESEPLGLDAL